MMNWKKRMALGCALVMLVCTLPFAVLSENEEGAAAAPAAEIVTATEPAEEPAEEPAAEPVPESAEEPAAAPAAEPPAAEPPAAEQPAPAPAEVPAEVPAAEPAEVPSEEPAVEPAEVPAAEPAAEPAEVPSEEPAAEPAEAPAAEPAEAPAAEPAEAPAAEPAEAPAAEPAEVPAAESAEEPAAEPAQEAAEESAAEPAEEPAAEEPAAGEPAEAAEAGETPASFTGALTVRCDQNPVLAGDTVVFQAVVNDANMEYSIRWELETEQKWTAINGANAEEYRFVADFAAGTYNYRAVLTAGDGTVLTAPLTLTVTEPAEEETAEEDPAGEEAAADKTEIIEDYETPLGLPQEEPEPEMKVSVFIDRNGDTLNLSSLTEGLDGYEIRYQWECDKQDGAGFQDVSGANESTYSIGVTPETLKWEWRLSVYF